MTSYLTRNPLIELKGQTLWSLNTPGRFWRCQPDPPEHVWQTAIQRSAPILGLGEDRCDVQSILGLILGEGRFGLDHWELAPFKKIYYRFKSIIPRSIIRELRHFYHQEVALPENWPIEPRYVYFLWEVLRQVLILSDIKELTISYFWPDGNPFTFVLTHDIETAEGQEYVPIVADLEESLGFRSLFNFVPESYEPDSQLMDSLRKRGFEVGVHGLKHNGRLFDSKSSFMRNASKINRYLKAWNATGFRAELMLRQPEWMQILEIEYDLSFFDTDPFEPISGGTMSIWPFFIGHFVELPYTLVQDHTLTSVLKETTPRIWLEKVDFIEEYHGMALINTHPDYLKSKLTWGVYYEFLNEMKQRGSYWHALPSEVAKWWRARSTSSPEIGIPDLRFSRAFLDGDHISIEI
jgi:hypothetical protein